MNTFGWVMLALGLFLVLYTAAFLLRPGRGRESLGCGFVLLAGLVWSIAVTQYVGDRGTGFRMGFGAAMILPATVSLFKGGMRRLVPAASLFVSGVLLIASAYPAFRQRIRPSPAESELVSLANGVPALRARIRKRDAQLDDLRRTEQRMRAEVHALTAADFDAAMADADSRRVIEEFAEVRGLRAAAEARLTQERAALSRMEAALRRAQIRAEADALSRAVEDDKDLARLLDETAGAADATTPATVEDHAARDEMRELFEEARKP